MPDWTGKAAVTRAYRIGVCQFCPREAPSPSLQFRERSAAFLCGRSWNLSRRPARQGTQREGFDANHVTAAALRAITERFAGKLLVAVAVI